MSAGVNEFLQRLKERKLVQWTVAYVAAAFAFLQGIDIVAQRFGWPEQTMRFVIIALSVGLFVTLVLAWYHGERGAQRVTGTELLILALLLAIGGGLLWRFAGGARKGGIREASAESSPAPVVIPEKSIAVLPFDNLSRDPDNAFFAEGVQDEILTRLAKVADLKVISRTSTQHFKSSPENLPEIAQQLGVRNILEGSVQKANDEVRVNVQLIHAPSDTHLWADIYDRKLTDLFAVESDIAKTIADTLQVKLSGPEQEAMSVRPTEDPEAYQLYLKGRFFWNKRTAPDLRKSIEFFNLAVQKDPNYARAYAAMAQSWILLPAYNGGAPKDLFPKAQAAAEKAIALDDTLSEAHAVLASLKQNYQFDSMGALAEYEDALKLNPNDATARQWMANNTLAYLGRSKQELEEMKHARELDPLSLVINTNLGVAYFHNGQIDQAIGQLRKTVEMDNSFYYGRWNLGLAYYLQGSHSQAIAELEKAPRLVAIPSPWESWAISTESPGANPRPKRSSSNCVKCARNNMPVPMGWRSLVSG